MYTPGDLATFMRIRDYAAQGIGLQRIKELLKFPPEPENKETALITMKDLFETLEFARGTIAAMRNEMQAQADRLTALEEYLALPWYKRIGKRPPVG